jgi:ribosome-binding protein aMBF1 (putative translation factor)
MHVTAINRARCVAIRSAFTYADATAPVRLSVRHCSGHKFLILLGRAAHAHSNFWMRAHLRPTNQNQEPQSRSTKPTAEHGEYVNIRKYAVNFFYRYKRSVDIEPDSRAVCAKLFRLLQNERQRGGISKYALAAEAGLSQQTIGYVERGMTSPSFDTIYRISKALNIDLAELVKRAEQQTNVKHG